MNIVPFGKIDPNNVEDYYDGSVNLGGDSVDIDLNFESESVSESVLVAIEKTMNQLPKFSGLAWKAISDDWDLDEESETARFYLQHHLDEFDEDEIIKLFGTNEINKDAFTKALSLVRIGLYPEDEDMFSVFDIQFSPGFTNYLMSISITQSGLISDISFES